MKTYAGIGARSTPAEVLSLMTDVGLALANEDWILQSGGADGADKAFEEGCDQIQGKKTIYTPEGEIPSWAFNTVADFHPNPEKLDDWATRAQARNALVLLHPEPVKFVVCWTPRGQKRGGTGQSLRIAEHYEIPIFNLFHDEVQTRLESFVNGCLVGQ